MKPTKEELVKRYINLVYYYAKRWVHNRDDVDYMVQDTYTKALMKYDSFVYASDNQLKSWLLIICRNTIFDVHKLKKPTLTFDTEMEATHIDSKAESWLDEEIKREDVEVLKNILKTLDDHDYEIIRLRYFDDLSFDEIASVFNVPEATAKMRCYRALKKLRKELSKV